MANIDSISDHLIAEAKLSTSFSNCELQSQKNAIATISQMWASISMQITEYNNIIVVPVKMFTIWSRQDQSFILTQYRNITDREGMFVADPILPRIFLGPVDHFRTKYLYYGDGCIPTLSNPNSPQSYSAVAQSSSRNSNSRTLESAHFSLGASNQSSSRGSQKRPPNSWILYRKSKHAETVSRNPGLTNNQISTLISYMWAAESTEVRSAYKAFADRIKHQHAVDNPGYRYKPRKPSEVKRRQKKKLCRVTSSNLKSTLFAQEQSANTEVTENINQSPQNDISMTSTSHFSSWTQDIEMSTSQILNPAQSLNSTSMDIDEINFEEYFERSQSLSM